MRALIGSVRVSVGSVHSDVVLSEEGAKEHLLLYGTWSDWYEHDLSFVKLSLYIYLINPDVHYNTVYTKRVTERNKTNLYRSHYNQR